MLSPLGRANCDCSHKTKEGYLCPEDKVALNIAPFGSFVPKGQPEGKVVAPLILPFGSLRDDNNKGVFALPLRGNRGQQRPRSLPPLVRFAVPPLGGKGWGNKGLYPLRFCPFGCPKGQSNVQALPQRGKTKGQNQRGYGNDFPLWGKNQKGTLLNRPLTNGLRVT